MLRLTELGDYVVPFALRVACEMRVADHLIEGPRSIADLAAATGAQPATLHRMLRTLAGRGVFAEPEAGVFALTPLSQPMRSDHPLSLREAYPLLAGDVAAWGRLDHSVRTGEAAFEFVHGQTYWQYMSEHSDENLRFNRSQLAATRLELRAILPAYPWDSLRTLVDVGGGNGAFLAGILARFKHLHGIVLDQPHVVSGAPDVLAAAKVADRCDVVGGSFFDGVPKHADAYILKRVLYHWDDEHAAKLLRVVRDAMRPDSKLLILEPIMQHGETNMVGMLFDLLLLTMAGGGGRTPERLDQLLRDAGLKLAHVTRTFMTPIAEVVPLLGSSC
jgi:SAM-dependent methyltransferase